MRVDITKSDEVDRTLLNWSRTNLDAPRRMSPAAERLLLERAKQTIMLAGGMQAENDMMLTVPAHLPERVRIVATALLWLHGMTLPFPVNDQALH